MVSDENINLILKIHILTANCNVHLQTPVFEAKTAYSHILSFVFTES